MAVAVAMAVGVGMSDSLILEVKQPSTWYPSTVIKGSFSSVSSSGSMTTTTVKSGFKFSMLKRFSSWELPEVLLLLSVVVVVGDFSSAFLGASIDTEGPLLSFRGEQ
ncbi:hypothetical protein NE237_012256 [Protea cynaroides]|uniref:Uncharacterized protein n=1 Tax=Protea cynaroides TaxID=273540 RepID=A0A9Q0JZ25_9MAGN|nr:hypothetical protein NE237_012256 [Protea cynaroides]